VLRWTAIVSNTKASSILWTVANEFEEINLNGGIVSNKGFIQQMASPGTSIIAGKYISAWGGIQSAGQTLGQIVRSSRAITKPAYP
jgi:hypothetical protein